MNKEHIIQQLNDIAILFEYTKAISKYEDLSDVEPQKLSAIISRSKAAVARIAGINSEYYKDIEKTLSYESGRYAFLHQKVLLVTGTVFALKDDISDGYIKNLYDIVQSEVFSNYIDMAEHLLEQGYKDAAAVIAGSTLEAHLKKLATSSQIEIEDNGKSKKANTLNEQLAKANIYTVAMQKQVTAWLAIRNDAAHGNYDNYNNDRVKLMIEGIRLFTLS